jgi:hypothetical protein
VIRSKITTDVDLKKDGVENAGCATKRYLRTLQMTNWPKQNHDALNAFYGNPDANGDFVPDPDWEAANIFSFSPPYQMWYPIELHGKIIKRRGVKMRALRIHKRIRPSFEKILESIGAMGSSEITKHELDIWGGCFNFRLKKE